MADVQDLSQRLARQAEIRQAPKRRRALTIGWRLAAIQATRATGRRLPVTATTFWGDRMHVILPEPLSCELYGYGFFEEGVSGFMLAELRAGQRVYDVGAHFGYFTRLASNLVGAAGAVHSFEPTPSTFAMLERNTDDLANVSCNQTAAWHSTESVRLKDFGPTMSMFNSLLSPRMTESSQDEAVDVSVQAVALDSYADRVGAPHFVKIDAESAEWSILQGMAMTLATDRPTVTVEVGDFGVFGAARSRALLDYVIDYGYTPFEYRDGRVARHALKESYEYDNILLIANKARPSHRPR